MFGGKTNEGLELANPWSTATSLDTEFDWDWLGGKIDGMEREKWLVREDTELGKEVLGGKNDGMEEEKWFLSTCNEIGRDVLGGKNFGMELGEKCFVSAGKVFGNGEEVLGGKNDGMQLGEKHLVSTGTLLGGEAFGGKSKNKEGEISLRFTEYELERGILTSMTGVLRDTSVGEMDSIKLILQNEMWKINVTKTYWWIAHHIKKNRSSEVQGKLLRIIKAATPQFHSNRGNT